MVSRDELAQYEKEYLDRLANQGKITSEDQNESVPSDEEIAEKIKAAERVQREAALQIQAAAAAKVQAQDESKERERLLSLIHI